MVERLCLKPYWAGIVVLLRVKSDKSLFQISRLNSLERDGMVGAKSDDS